MVNIGIDKIVHNGAHTSFRNDRWISSSALSAVYPHLYNIAVDPTISVADVFADNLLNLRFYRQLVDIYLDEWSMLLNQVSSFQLSSDLHDQIKWRWSSSGLFSVKSFYSWLDFGGVPTT